MGWELLGFVNVVRSARCLSALSRLVVVGTDADDEEGCVLARAMCCSVGGSDEPCCAQSGQWVMRFADRVTARRVALATGSEWLTASCEVALPVALVDFAVSLHFGLVETDEHGELVAWRVPSAHGVGGFDRHEMPARAFELVAA